MNLWKISTFVLLVALGATVTLSAVTPAQAEPQPHMQAALTSLKVAKDQLEKATADKGGHRVKAIGHVKDAISEVEKGIAFDNKH